MPNAKDITIKDKKLKVLIYGPSGVGKTRFACTFPKPYVFDFDNGMLSVRGIDVEYDTYFDEDKNGKNVTSALKEFKKKMASLSDSYETLVIDSVTTLQDYSMNELLRLNNREEPTLHEWGRLVSWLSDTFLTITKNKINVVIIAHEQTIKDELTGEINIQPLIVGKKMPNQLPLFFDEVYRLGVRQSAKDIDGNRKSIFEFRTTGTNRYIAKSRLDVLDDLEVWTNANAYKIIMEKVNV